MTAKKDLDDAILNLDLVTALTALDRLEEQERAAYTMKRRPTPRKHPQLGGKKTCKTCGMRIRGKVENHNAGDHHRNSIKGKG